MARVVSRRTTRAYTHVIACEQSDGSWSPCAFTEHPEKALSTWSRGRYNRNAHFRAVPIDK